MSSALAISTASTRGNLLPSAKRALAHPSAVPATSPKDAPQSAQAFVLVARGGRGADGRGGNQDAGGRRRTRGLSPGDVEVLLHLPLPLLHGTQRRRFLARLGRRRRRRRHRRVCCLLQAPRKVPIELLQPLPANGKSESPSPQSPPPPSGKDASEPDVLPPAPRVSVWVWGCARCAVCGCGCVGGEPYHVPIQRGRTLVLELELKRERTTT